MLYITQSARNYVLMNFRKREKGMDEKKLGPLLSDEQFFGECLNLDYPGMEAVKEAVADKDYSLAKKEMASYIRKTLDADHFFEIPYEIPENIYKLPGESDAEAAERICNHTLVSVGVPCEYGKENTVDWEANPTYNGYKEWTWQLSRHNDIKLLAHEYNKTRNEKLAYAAAELMDSWMKQAVCPDADCAGYKTKCWRTIECGIRMGANWPYILFTFYKTPAFTDDLLIDFFTEKFSPVIDSEIKSAAKTAFVTTAISQTAFYDMFSMLSVNLHLIRTIVESCGYRPSGASLLGLYVRILKATFLAGGLEEMDLEELLPLVTGNAAMKLPGLVFASAAQGTVNAFMTIRVGILTKKYLFSADGPIEMPQARKDSYKEAIDFLKKCELHKDVIAIAKKTAQGAKEAAAASVKKVFKSPKTSPLT